MEIRGQGMWIWVIDSCEGGNVAAIIQKAKEHSIKFIMPKATNGVAKYSRNWPKIKELTDAAHEEDIAVVPWGWVFGRSPYSPYPSLSAAEGKLAADVVAELGAEGWIVDAEHDWKRPHLDMYKEVDKYMDAIESGFVSQGINVPVFVSTYRYPNYHREFPFTTWENRLRPERGDGWMPQVYWEFDYNSLAGQTQLVATINQYAPYLDTNLDFIPAGAGYSRGDWSATPTQIRGFYEEAIKRDMPASLWSWQHLTSERWAVAKEVWGGIIEPDEPSDPEEPSDPLPFLKEVMVTAYALNVRMGPHYKNPLAGNPLRKGDIVPIYAIEGDWGKISENECKWISLYWVQDYEG